MAQGKEIELVEGKKINLRIQTIDVVVHLNIIIKSFDYGDTFHNPLVYCIFNNIFFFDLAFIFHFSSILNL